MAKKLRGVTPEDVKQQKPKILIFGAGGVGKTWVSLEWPKVYYIDTEGGADQQHYIEKLRKAGGVYMGPDQGSQDFNVVLDEIQTLATTQHDYQTLVIDSFSKLYNIVRGNVADSGKDDFGKDKKEANKPSRRLINWIDRIRMNVVLICHEAPAWSGGQQAGTTFDGFDKLSYELDLLLNVQLRGSGSGAKRVAIVKKSRLLGFPMGEEFEWTFDSVADRYGRDAIYESTKPIELATEEQVAEIHSLLAQVTLTPDWTENTLTKAKASRWEEVDRDKAAKVIEFLKAKKATEKPL